MTAPALIEPGADPMAAMRALSRMTRAGFALALEDNALVVSPADQLSEKQRDYIRANRGGLVALLMDAEIVYRALALAVPAGLAFHEGTPGDWDNTRLLAAGEVLYADGRMVNRNDRRYLLESAPPIPDLVTGQANVIPIDRDTLPGWETTP